MKNDNKSGKNPTVSSIPFLGGRPERDTVISHDEIVNLMILLNTVSTVESFEAAIA